MASSVEMLEAVLDLVEAGVVLLDEHSCVLFWNKAASELTGYAAIDVIFAPCPRDLYLMDSGYRARADAGFGRSRSEPASFAGSFGYAQASYACADKSALLEPHPDLDSDPDLDEGNEAIESPTLASMAHQLGHRVPAMLRRFPLHSESGERSGTVLLFYAVEDADTLPRGEAGGRIDVERSQAEMEDLLEAAQHLWKANRVPFGLLWIMVDQAQTMRSTHGRDACEAMLHSVEQTLRRQMRPAEVLGRWGSNEFLAISHERTVELLLGHARRLAGMARTADFHWWGDRVGLTVSVGVSLAGEGQTLHGLLNSARQAMRAAAYAGGNQAAEAREI